MPDKEGLNKGDTGVPKSVEAALPKDNILASPAFLNNCQPSITQYV